MGLAFNSDVKRCGIIELSHKIKALQKANSCNSKLFGLVDSFVHLSYVVFFPLSFTNAACLDCLFKADLDHQ